MTHPEDKAEARRQRLEEQPKARSMTKGEYRVGVDFNPSGNPVVTHIKAVAASLIDMIEAIPNEVRDGEIARLKAEAQTGVEGAAHWAVKAATKKPWEK